MASLVVARAQQQSAQVKDGDCQKQLEVIESIFFVLAWFEFVFII
jgi:hypothetical protein